MQFSFPIRGAVKSAWNTFKRNYGLFLITTIILLVLEMTNRVHGRGFFSAILSLVIFFAIMIWMFVSIKTSLLSIATTERLPIWQSIRTNMPTLKQLLSLIAVVLIEGVLIVVPIGICMGIAFSLLIHGMSILAFVLGAISIVALFYLGVRFHFAVLSYIKGKGIIESIKYSIEITKGVVFWNIIVVMLVQIIFIFVGTIIFGIGLLVTYPLAMLLSVQLYQALVDFREHKPQISENEVVSTQ